MKINQEFTVDRPTADVWSFFQDVPTVAQCLPGATLTDDSGDGQYGGRVEVKLGPMSIAFEGKATVTPDPTTMSGHIDGKGADKRGGSRGTIAVDYRLVDHDGSTQVLLDADVVLSGPAAQFGRTGLIQEMTGRLISEFVNCLEAKLEAETPEEAAAVTAREVKGLSLFFASFWATLTGWLKRLFGRSQD